MASNTFATISGEGFNTITARERVLLLVSVLIISICGLVYELIIGTLTSYLLGDSITQFSFTIGLYLFAMGVGALISRRILGAELRWFIVVELLVGLFGGTSAAFLYMIFSTSEVYYYTGMVAVTMAIGITVGLEIPLLTRIVANRADLGRALSSVLSIDYLGALVASLAFPLFLLPVLGVTQTAFVTGLLNIVVAAVSLRLFRQHIQPRTARQLWIAVGALSVLMFGGTILSTDFVHFFEQRLYQEHIIFREQSTYQRIIVTYEGTDLRLYINGDLQFSSRDEYRYHEMLVHPAMGAAHSHESVLVLGGGDGVAVRELLKYKDVPHIVLIDLDPAMTHLARTFLPIRGINQNSLNDPRVSVINQDAYKFLQQSTDLFSAVIIDLPDPNNEGLGKLYSQQFYQLLRTHLTGDGVFVTQAASPYFVREAFWMIAHTIQASGFSTVQLHTNVPSFGDWGYVIGMVNHAPQVKVPGSIALRYLTPDVLGTAQIFDPDTAEIPTGINTLDKPILLHLYEQGWRKWE